METITPDTSPKPFCFVLMPFADKFKDVYELGIKESCRDAGMYCERADEQIFSESIMERVYNQIAKADIIIADMTGKSLNVFYEVGYAHALNKPTILLTSNVKDIPFDLQHKTHIIYDRSITTLKEQLIKKLIYFRENLGKEGNKFISGIDLYIENRQLTLEKVSNLTNAKFFLNYGENEFGSILGTRIEFNVTIHNSSPKSYLSGQFRIGVNSKHKVDDNFCLESTQLPDGTYLSMLPTSPDTLYPEAYTNARIRMTVMSETPINEIDEISLKVFSESGLWTYPVKLAKMTPPQA